jgi:antitoxin component YwqK of YwqJK toxin-antitoxin module
MFVNGKEDGDLIFWDTNGNVIGHQRFRNGNLVGLDEAFWSPERPSLKKHYNSKGEEDGIWQEWWKNGNLKKDLIAKNGQIISGTEYYRNGKPRIRYVGVYSKVPKSFFETEYLEGEAWTPSGKSTGKIVKGNGSWVVFPDEADTTSKTVFRETYKGKTLARIDTLSRAEVEALLK